MDRWERQCNNYGGIASSLFNGFCCPVDLHLPRPLVQWQNCPGWWGRSRMVYNLYTMNWHWEVKTDIKTPSPDLVCGSTTRTIWASTRVVQSPPPTFREAAMMNELLVIGRSLIVAIIIYPWVTCPFYWQVLCATKSVNERCVDFSDKGRVTCGKVSISIRGCRCHGHSTTSLSSGVKG